MMAAVIAYFGVILGGLALGAFCQPIFLLVLTLIWLAVLIYLFATCKEITALIPLIVLILGLIEEAVMWFSAYYHSDSQWLGQFVHTYVLK